MSERRGRLVEKYSKIVYNINMWANPDHEAFPANESNTAEIARIYTAEHVGNRAMIGAVSLELDESAPSPEAMAIDQLRATTHEYMKTELSSRIEHNPNPTQAEQNMGMYVEGLEPQVRSAVPMMRQKGYDTTGSGFISGNWRALGGDAAEQLQYPDERGQVVDFRRPFVITDEVKGRLSSIGVEVVEHPMAPGAVSRIGFSTSSPDLEAMQAYWNTIADVLPDTGTPAPAIDPDVAAVAFRINLADIGVSAEQLSMSPLAAGV